MLHVLSVGAILLDHGLKKVNNSDLPLQPKVSQMVLLMSIGQTHNFSTT